MSSRNTQWDNLQQTGVGTWAYNQSDFDYNQDLSLQETLQVAYNYLGDSTVWTNLDLI